MGGCATKPKELKAEAAEAPAPEPAKEEASEAAVVSDAKDVVIREESKKAECEAVVDQDKEIVDDDKRRSLSSLFKENEGKGSTEHDKTQLNLAKQEEPLVTEESTDVSETKPDESGKTETPLVQTLREVVEVPIEAKVEKAVEIAPTTATSDEKAIESSGTIETQKIEEEKKIVEEKSVVETQEPEMSEEKRIVEEKPTIVVTERPETPEEKATKEER